MFDAKNATPLNTYPLWKYILIALVLIVAFLYALPQYYGDSPSVQVTAKSGAAITSSMMAKANKILVDHKLSPKRVEKTIYNASFIFKSQDQQKKALNALKQGLGAKYVIAMTLLPNTPSWLQAIGASPMNLGLDLRGGMSFLLQVDMKEVMNTSLEGTRSALRKDLRLARIRYSGIKLEEKSNDIIILFRDNAMLGKAKDYISRQYPDLRIVSSKGDLRVAYKEAEVTRIKQSAIGQTLDVMRNRVNKLGVTEAKVTPEIGKGRLLVELPGIQDAAKAKQVIQSTASLKVFLVDQAADVQSALQGNVPIGDKIYYDEQGVAHVLKNNPVITGAAVVGAKPSFDQQTGMPIVSVNLTGPQVSRFSRVTGENVNKPMAIVLVEINYVNKKVAGKIVPMPVKKQTVISVATIISQLGNRFQISGGNITARSAQILALKISSGALPAGILILQEQNIGPSLGKTNIRIGIISMVLSFVAIIIFMLCYYRLFGVIASCALILCGILIVAIMAITGMALSLTGMAGIALNLGIAIDANVLIFERIREEIRQGTTMQAAIHLGYERAFTTIIDSHVTTLIVAVILFAIASSNIKGFAVTLVIGIVVSLFTNVFVTRGITNLIYGKRAQLKRISIGI